MSQAGAIAAVLGVAAQRPVETVWIGIDGRGAAGKTSFASALAEASPRVVVVHVDDFSGPGIPQWDWARLGRQVRDPMAAGNAGRYQRWDWDRDEAGEWHDVPVGAVVVVEGVSSTRSEVDIPWAVQIWVDAPLDERLRRARERDGTAMLTRWLDDWMPSEEAYIQREDPLQRVDLLVSGIESVPASSGRGESGQGRDLGQ